MVAQERGEVFETNKYGLGPHGDKGIAQQALKDVADWLGYTVVEAYRVALPKLGQAIFNRATA